MPGKRFINLPTKTGMFIRGQPNLAVKLDELDDWNFNYYGLLSYVTRRVTFGPNAQMTSQSKMTLK